MPLGELRKRIKLLDLVHDSTHVVISVKTNSVLPGSLVITELKDLLIQPLSGAIILEGR